MVKKSSPTSLLTSFCRIPGASTHDDEGVQVTITGTEKKTEQLNLWDVKA